MMLERGLGQMKAILNMIKSIMTKKSVTFEDLQSILKSNNELLIHEMKDTFVTKKDIVENNKNLVTKRDLVENNKNLVTKQDLIENNKNIVTKQDLVKNNKNLVTKQDLVENNKNLVTKQDLVENNEEVISAVENYLSRFPTKDEYYASQDKLMKEIRDLRDEVTVHNHQVQRNADDIRALKKSAFKN